MSRYNDIALYKLAKEVIFSEYILPICLNTDPSLIMNELIATGWGQTEDGLYFLFYIVSLKCFIIKKLWLSRRILKFKFLNGTIFVHTK